MQLTALDGRAYAKFIVAGTYFLRKYSAELNDLNVFPVPDGDTGSNMYLTLRAAALEASKAVPGGLDEVATAAATGSLIAARGNSGVIMSQMLRGFAHYVRHRDGISTLALAEGMKQAVLSARAALQNPVEGTIISVAEAAAQAAHGIAAREPDFYRLMSGVLAAAAGALERTRNQIAVLREANVVDAGAAGFLYFLEGFLRFLPGSAARSTAFPQRAAGKVLVAGNRVFAKNKYCTEFILEGAVCEPSALREALQPAGDSLIVGGACPTLRVHIHTDSPKAVTSVARRHGSVARLKVDDMEQQHDVLLLERSTPTVSVVALTNGAGFKRIMRELGAEITIAGNLGVRDLLAAVNQCIADRVFLLLNDADCALAALGVPPLSSKTVEIVATRDSIGGIAALLALRSQNHPTPAALLEAAERVKSATIFFAGEDTALGGTAAKSGKPAANYGGRLFGGSSIGEVTRTVLTAMEPSSGGLITLYFGAAQEEKDAQALSQEVSQAFPALAVEYYYGGQPDAEYLVSLDE
ncbi:MAG: DAK2 domain-containing protein [Candidatus Eremiobacteraeota bacterium]|nr:DAK2 domain-containing protein [Candidatus Eremiobacteraeota bacterium]